MWQLLIFTVAFTNISLNICISIGVNLFCQAELVSAFKKMGIKYIRVCVCKYISINYFDIYIW